MIVIWEYCFKWKDLNGCRGTAVIDNVYSEWCVKMMNLLKLDQVLLLGSQTARRLSGN